MEESSLAGDRFRSECTSATLSMSPPLLVNISVEWLSIMKNRHMDLFLIPTVLLTSCTMLVNPVLFLGILCFPSLRQETRYLLLANTLFADMLFLTINLAVVSCNKVGMFLPHMLCEFMMVSTVTTYSCSVLTLTLMVIDTYVAVRWPLRYNEILPASRARKIIISLWVVASLCPVSLLVMFELVMENSQQKRPVCLVLIALFSLDQKMKIGVHLYFIFAVSLCTALIVYCYIRLYIITKTSGIWRSRYSRARMTLLAHTLLLMMYFIPALVFAVELALLKQDATLSDVGVWIDLVNMCVLMLLPRSFTPYLYILRYREIYKTLQQVLWKKRRLSQISAA
ncbi:probable G-protein coupled receptor 148 [Myxocyprinus asiaticus]|uniref:probable G-protein coupled receptor 148 n=1 Tax=Myxocyprinus asiaticus TaxID=70543 RepID=UPI0022213BB6|nr:probable G-protein coupled receptor 148 [Myxocyprinus asiaticus]